MYVNKPASAAQPAAPEIDQARAGSAAATPVNSSTAASASAPIVSASAAIPQVPLHSLGTSSVNAPGFIAIPDDDTMSVIAGYLKQKDQLALRTLSGALQKAVDRSVEALSLDPQSAMDLFKDGNRLPNLKTLYLRRWNNENLSQLASALQLAKQRPFELRLSAPFYSLRNSDESATLGLEHTVSMRLSMLSLDGLTLTAGLANALAKAEFPIELDAFTKDGALANDIHLITRMPTLISLTLPDDHALSDATASAIQSHPSLRELACKTLMPGQLRKILANPKLESLSFAAHSGSTEKERDEAYVALANHAKLTSLTIGYACGQDIKPLSRSTTISTLNLYLYIGDDAREAISSLANMPALRDLTLRMGTSFNGQDFGPQLSASDIQAICAKQLERLDLSQANLDQTALAVAVGAKATQLAFGLRSGQFDQAAITGLVANPHVSSVDLYANCEAPGASMEQLAASPTITYLKLNITTTTDTAESITTAWLNAGKPLIDLKCVIQREVLA